MVEVPYDGFRYPCRSEDQIDEIILKCDSPKLEHKNYLSANFRLFKVHHSYLEVKEPEDFSQMKDEEACVDEGDMYQEKDSNNEVEKLIRYKELISDPQFMQQEIRVVRKLDFIVLPCITMCHFFSALDKSNLGNAKTDGIEKDLKLSASQYGNIVSMTYVTFLLFQVPVGVSLKYVGPKKLLSFCVFSFGIIALCCGFVQGYAPLMVCRLLIGLFESGIVPVVNVFLGMVYTKNEMAKRCAIIYSASAISGAFGGLAAYGLIRIPIWAGWRWLFTIEGALTLCLVPFLVIFLPDEFTRAWWLNQKEKEVLKMRFEYYPDFFHDEKFTWSEVLRAFKDINNYVLSVYEFCVHYTLFGVSNFLPTIIKKMGFSKYNTQLMTVPVYVIAWVSFMLSSYYSDKWTHRGGFLIIGCIVSLVGYIILYKEAHDGVRYIGCLLIGIGLYTSSSLSFVWANSNNGGHYKRATMGGMISACGAAAGILIGQAYDKSLQLGYEIGFTLLCIGIFMVVFLMWNYDRLNKKREALGQDISIKAKDDRDINFRFIL